MGGEGVLLVRCVVEREGLRLRIGGVKTRVLPGMGGGPTVDARTPRRKGTGSERTCMLVGRFSVWPFVCACAVMDGERWGGATRPGDWAGGDETWDGNKDSLPEGVRVGCAGRSSGVEPSDAKPGVSGEVSILAVKVCTMGSPSPSSTRLNELRFSCRVGGLFSGVDGLIFSGRLKGAEDCRLPGLIMLARCAFAWAVAA